jgi:hypothetical protein
MKTPEMLEACNLSSELEAELDLRIQILVHKCISYEEKYGVYI